MANMDAKALRARDQSFAARLNRRDKSVVADIDDAYSPALYKLLVQKEGPFLRVEDIEDIVQDTLVMVWLKFSAQAGKKSVRCFFFDQAKWKVTDLLRRRYREKRTTELMAAESDPNDFVNGMTPVARHEARELARTELTILALVDNMVAGLTDRQRLAFQRRFFGEASRSWAKSLEDETGVSASAWRKASDDAKKTIVKQLSSKGLIRKEGGRYEVA